MKRIAALGGLLLATPLQAADIIVLASQQEPAIVVVRGGLNPGDQNTFQQTVGRLKAVIVYLESPGGAVNAGVDIGATIRKRGLETAVADGKTCTSACALAWLAGSPRRMGRDARIGFHTPVDRNTKQVAFGALLALWNYVRWLDLPPSAYTLVTMAEPQSMTWLTETHSVAYKVPYSELRRDQAFIYHVVSAHPMGR